MTSEFVHPTVGRRMTQKRQYHDHGTLGHLDGASLTPRDPNAFNGQQNKVQNDFRFQGYPAGMMEESKFPRKMSYEHGTASPPPNLYYGLPNHFDTNRPKAFDHPTGGLQYGSDEVPQAQNGPRPIRDPFNEKTSAEVAKYRQHQENVEKDIMKYKEEKQMKVLERENEKKKDMEQLMQYNPWGKPGGGAPPQGSNNKKVFTEVDEMKHRATPPRPPPEIMQEYGDFHDNFGKAGAGAPLRTESGTITTNLKQDPSIRFQDTVKGRQVYEQEVRYRKGTEEKVNYSKALEEQVREKNMEAQSKRIQELQKELEMLKHDPYGRPGAGAPNINKSHSEPSESRQNNRGQKFDFYDPWGKGAGQPHRDRYGDVIRHKHTNTKDDQIFTQVTPRKLDRFDDQVGNSIDFKTGGGAGAPVITESGHIKTRMPITMERDFRGDAKIKEELPYGPSPRRNRPDDPEHQIYDPFGKSGAGAPMRDVNGNVNATVYGRMKNETDSAQRSKKAAAQSEYLHELQSEMLEQKRKRQEQDENLRTGAGELAALMKQGQVGRPRRDPNTGMLLSQHLPASDVTKEQTNTRTQKFEGSEEYHTELERAAEERKRSQELDRLKDRQQSHQHGSTMDNFWGRPGGGAPKHDTKKANLDNILYSPRKEADLYNKQLPNGHLPYNKVKSTVPSTHVNLYEMEKDIKREPKKDYKLLTPFATESNEVY